MPRELSVAVVGATGAVGREFVSLFEKRSFPIKDLRLLASERSAGKRIPFRGEEIEVQVATPENLKALDVAFFSAGASRSKALIPAALEQGAICIDNSSAFRMDEHVPLIVPEINWSAAKPTDRLFPVANCTAIVLCMAVAPLLKLGKVERLVVSTYQSASGGGATMMEALQEQTKEMVSETEGRTHGRELGAAAGLKEPYGFNLFSHNTPINEHGYNEEEWKVIQETKKILERPDLRVNVTCVRVPVLRAHSESITVEFAGQAPSEQAIWDAYAEFPGIVTQDERDQNRFPTPQRATGRAEVLVGRVRRDVSHTSAICLFACGDQLLKGAALNGLQIAERLIAEGRFEQQHATSIAS